MGTYLNFQLSPVLGVKNIMIVNQEFFGAIFLNK
jgi:hypothetical protein